MVHMRAPRQPGKATKGGSELRPDKDSHLRLILWFGGTANSRERLRKKKEKDLDRKGDPRVSTDTVEGTLCPQYTECVSAQNDK